MWGVSVGLRLPFFLTSPFSVDFLSSPQVVFAIKNKDGASFWVCLEGKKNRGL